MKTKILILFIVLFTAACSSTIPIQVDTGNPKIKWDGKTLCIGQDFSASADTNQLAQGVKLGDDVNYIIIKYTSGKLTAEGHGCYQLIK